MALDTASTNQPERRGVGLRARLVAAFVAIAALTTLVATLLTSVGLHDRFDAYLEQRTEDAGRSAVASAEQGYADVPIRADGQTTVRAIPLAPPYSERFRPVGVRLTRISAAPTGRSCRS